MKTYTVVISEDKDSTKVSAHGSGFTQVEIIGVLMAHAMSLKPFRKTKPIKKKKEAKA